MSEETNPALDKKGILEPLAPAGVREALAKFKKVVRPAKGIDLVGLTQSLIARRKNKIN